MKRRDFISIATLSLLGAWVTSIFWKSGNEKTQNSIQENLDAKVIIGKQIDELSSEGAKSYEILWWNKKVGTLIKSETEQWRTAKVMLLTAKRSPALFENVWNNEYYPDVDKIRKYFLSRAKEENNTKSISLITTGPTFLSWTTLSWLNYDNWLQIGNDDDLEDRDTKGRWIGYIQGWELNFSHTDELTATDMWNLIQQKSDIFTMSSVKRNGKINHDSSLRHHPYFHCVVQYTDGTRWEVILNDVQNAEQRKKIFQSLPEIDRALYADADAKQDYLDGIFIKTKQWIQYSHPGNGDLSLNPNAKSVAPEKNNMPAVLVYYAEK